MPEQHRWKLTGVEFHSSDRFHLMYWCDHCQQSATQAWGTAGLRKGAPKLFKKNLPIVERHFAVDDSPGERRLPDEIAHNAGSSDQG